jgi:hypothetical protein
VSLSSILDRFKLTSHVVLLERLVGLVVVVAVLQGGLGLKGIAGLYCYLLLREVLNFAAVFWLGHSRFRAHKGAEHVRRSRSLW